MTTQLVVADPAALTTTDTSWQSLLAEWGHTVVLVDDGAAASLTGVDLVVLSGSAVAATVSTKYRDAAVPLVGTTGAQWTTCMEVTNANASAYGGSGWTVLDDTHPVLDPTFGPTGTTIPVVSSTQTLNQVVNTAVCTGAFAALRGTAATSYTLFTVPTGGALHNSRTAAARRIAIGIVSAMPTLTATGQRLMRQAVEHGYKPPPVPSSGWVVGGIAY